MGRSIRACCASGPKGKLRPRVDACVDARAASELACWRLSAPSACSFSAAAATATISRRRNQKPYPLRLAEAGHDQSSGVFRNDSAGGASAPAKTAMLGDHTQGHFEGTSLTRYGVLTLEVRRGTDRGRAWGFA